jgi:hypothetical protein
MAVEVLSSREHIIFLNGKKSLWFEKRSLSSCSLKEGKSWIIHHSSIRKNNNF